MHQTTIPILVINLPDATERMDAFRRHWSPSQQLYRLDAVDGRQGRLKVADVDLSIRTRQFMQNRLEISDIMTLHSSEAVANFLSHRMCWRRILEEKWPLAMVMEDDACPKPSFQPWLDAKLPSLTQNAKDWDFVMIGFELLPFQRPDRYVLPHAVGDVSLGKPMSGIHHKIFGSHAYLISQSGAETLLRLSQPLELHVDMFMLLTASMELARGYLVGRESLVRQCMLTGRHRRLYETGGSIPHFDWDLTNVKCMLPDISVRHGLYLMLTCVALLIGLIIYRSGSGTRKKNASAPVMKCT